MGKEAGRRKGGGKKKKKKKRGSGKRKKGGDRGRATLRKIVLNGGMFQVPEWSSVPEENK